MSIYRTRNGDLNFSSIKTTIQEKLKHPELIERTKFENSQNASLMKAINNIENPVKEKHVRNIILGSCYEKSALPFWYSTERLQLYGNGIVCWKFCYVLHRLLRDGHSSCVEDSFRFVKTLDDLANSWVHLKFGYGTMLFHYCTYLAYKINFHKKNQFIPANLNIEERDLNDIVSNDINNYFELCCEFFDYVDKIIALQESVYVTMDRSRSNSMTESGQCKLAPLVLCIQESNQLFDFCVKFMFKLHETLPNEVLEGHRLRFANIYEQFYECSKNLQYFKTLISIPTLPDIPNFRRKSELSLYTKPVMVVMEQHPQLDTSTHTDEDILVDFVDNQTQLNTSSSSSNNNSNSNNDSFQLQQIQQQQYVNQLIQETERLRLELDRVSLDGEFEIRNLRDRIKYVQDEMVSSKTELEQQKIRAANLEEKLRIMSENEKAKADIENLEKKAISSEEKFFKMKELYTKLKDQHVNLLRQEADVRKQNLSLTEASSHAHQMKKELELRLEEAAKERQKLEADFQLKLGELHAFKSDNEKKQADIINSNQRHLDKIKELEELNKKLDSDLTLARKRINEKETVQKELEGKCSNLILDVEKLENEFGDSKLAMAHLQQKFNEMMSAKDSAERLSVEKQINFRKTIFKNTVSNCVGVVKESLQLFDDPILFKCRSGAEFLLSRMAPMDEYLNQMLTSFNQFINSNKNNTDFEHINFVALLKYLNSFANLTSETVIYGKIVSLTAADIQQGEALAEDCREFGQKSVSLLNAMSLEQLSLKDESEMKQMKELSEKIAKKLNELLPKVHDINKDEIGDLVDQEMHNTTEAIESAVARLESLINKSREQETGVKLEVNDKILDSCTGLMKAIKELIIKAKDLQKEIVARGRGTSSVKEFYAKNHKWTEGLVSAAKLVGIGANFLIEKADKLVNGDGKLEEIIVCSHEIAASTAQLAVASNVKAELGSQKRVALMTAKSEVSSATANLVALVKSCSKKIDDQSSMDFTKISMHQSKLLEMEAQVKILELEKSLETEKSKLYRLRKQNYKTNEESAI